MFYVSVQKGDRTVLALGPFRTHGAALGREPEVRRYVVDHDRHGWTYAYGTCRHRTEHPPGALNDRISYTGPGGLP